MIISPIFYMGNKKKLINKGLIDLFPSEIDNFYDMFGGSGVVSLNTKANNIYLNDKDINLYNLYSMFHNMTADEIVKNIEENINKYNLALERTKRNQYFDIEKLEKYKSAYVKLRNEYNKNKNILDFYTLTFYSFSQQFRFNKKGEFNMPIGNDYFSEKNKDYIYQSRDVIKNCHISNFDFRHYIDNINNFTKNDFIYIDPPYLDTTATYNEQGGWTEHDEFELLRFCEQLNNRGIKFGLSNVFECKGKVNQKLIDWCNENHFTVYMFDKFTYMACGKGNSHAKEVFICNYNKEEAQ